MLAEDPAEGEPRCPRGAPCRRSTRGAEDAMRLPHRAPRGTAPAAARLGAGGSCRLRPRGTHTARPWPRAPGKPSPPHVEDLPSLPEEPFVVRCAKRFTCEVRRGGDGTGEKPNSFFELWGINPTGSKSVCAARGQGAGWGQENQLPPGAPQARCRVAGPLQSSASCPPGCPG